MRIPKSFRMTNLPITSNYPIIRTQSQSGKTLKRRKEAQRWQATLSFPRLTLAQLRELRGLFASIGQAMGEFEIILPKESQPMGPAEGEPVVRNAAQPGTTAIEVVGLTPNQTALKRGSYIKFSGHSKVYMVTTDITASADGHATMHLFPGIVTSITAAETVIWRDVPFTFEMDDDPLEWEYQDYKHADLEVDVTEKL